MFVTSVSNYPVLNRVLLPKLIVDLVVRSSLADPNAMQMTSCSNITLSPSASDWPEWESSVQRRRAVLKSFSASEFTSGIRHRHSQRQRSQGGAGQRRRNRTGSALPSMEENLLWHGETAGDVWRQNCILCKLEMLTLIK